jgi:hypothetical protein
LPSTTSTAFTTLPLSYPAGDVARLADGCRAVAGGIADDLNRRAGAAGVARAGWSGVHRHSFDGTYTACNAALGDLRDRLLRLAAALQNDRVAADHENAVRAARRAEVEAEHRRQEQTTSDTAVAP